MERPDLRIIALEKHIEALEKALAAHDKELDILTEVASGHTKMLENLYKKK